MPAPAAVTLDGVGMTFGSGAVLSDINLAITAGSFVSLVGPSGCGKSTLLRLIAGLMDPTAGRVWKDADAIGFVFQDPTLMPWATAAANVALPLELGGAPDAASRAQDALRRVGLGDFAGAYPRQLSGGMRMRVSIARATVTAPRLLLMDEPFAALDEFTRQRLNDDLIALWRAEGWTVVFVTHSIREAVYLSERVVVMSPHPGRIVADMAMGLPRAERLRDGHALADQCAAVTRVLERAMAS